MRFSFVLGLIISSLISLNAIGDQPKRIKKERTSDFIHINAVDAAKIQCGSKNLLEMTGAYQYMGASPAMSTQEDDELLCYRCCFGKMSKDDCGIYKEKYGDEKWAKECPKQK